VAEIEYETRDVSVRWAVKAGAAFLALALFGGGVCLGVYALLVRIHAREERPAAPLAQAPGRLPPVPRLQSRPQSDLAELRAQHLRELTTYGWVNQQAGTTHIDIEEAMRLYAARAAGATGAAGAAPARLDIPPEAAGPAGTPTMPAVAPTPGASASPAARPHP
jgi:hypothetical protein